MPSKIAEIAAPSASSKPETTLVPFAYRAGDVLLRAGTEAWIQKLTNGLYSHSGICTDPENEVCTDAHPADVYHVGIGVGDTPIHYFFNQKQAPGGGAVFRHHDPAVAAKAAQWAKQQAGKPYRFNIRDPLLGPTGEVIVNNQVYCSEFVWLSYYEGAGVRLVQESEFINLLSEENQERTIDVLLPSIREQEDIPSYLPDAVVRPRVLEDMKKRHNGYFISPSQLAAAYSLDRVHAIRGGAVFAHMVDDGSKK